MPLGYPEMPRNFGNQFANNTLTMSGTSGGGPSGSTVGSTAFLVNTQNFGFVASLIKVNVDAGALYLNLSGNVATTADFKLTSGDLLTDFYDIGSGVAGISFAATSTAPTFRMGAWG